MSSGGGGQSQTTSGGIDPEFKPYLQRALQDAETMRQAEAATPSLVRHQAAQAYAAPSTEEEVYRRALASGQGSQALGGRLGSARAQRAAAAAAGDAALNRRDAEMQQKLAAAQAFEDAPHRSLERFFGYLGNAPQQQTTTSKGGGK